MYISTGGELDPYGTDKVDARAPTNPTTSASPTASAVLNGQQNSNSGMSTAAIVAIAVAIAVLVVILLSCILVRRIRASHQNPKYIPTKFLKKRWESWNPGSTRLPRTTDNLEPSRQPAASFGNAAGPTVPSATAGIDRNTSVRSVMTLPAYHPDPRHNERVLGREGERGGIDVVVEYPETVDEVEARREEEMEALYQVRLARRRENEEREQRRNERREARERGDYVALREIQARARAASNATGARTVEELRRDVERIKKERNRAVSSVSYADLGVARHDGTRIRASQDSERQGLLGDAASIAASGQYHRRDRSTSSVLSIDTMSDFPSPALTRSRADSNAESLLADGRRESRASSDGAGSSPEIISHDDVPPHSPPDYENIPLDTPHPSHPPQEPPPEYASPVERRASARFPEPTRQASTRSHTSEEEGHNSSSEGATSPERSSSTEAAAPQLPSLHLQAVPSIVLDSPSPVTRRREGDDEDFS
ncbi:hypothetical protein F5884DRAFT_818425 [Xylogone sp. PMI_703]|nr:hypothetical protein F5884DRAFT_818425 [Xylogone sp. PMI_703]